MAKGVNGGPARFYRRRSLAEQREAFQIASAEVAVLEAKAGRVAVAAEERINRSMRKPVQRSVPAPVQPRTLSQ